MDDLYETLRRLDPVLTGDPIDPPKITGGLMRDLVAVKPQLDGGSALPPTRDWLA